MEKTFFKKYILSIITLSFLLFQITFPIITNASVLPWDNPNKSTSYKMNMSDFLNTRNAMTVIGCTGIVNKVASVAVDTVKSLAMSKAERDKIKEQKDNISRIKNAGTVTGKTFQSGGLAAQSPAQTSDTGSKWIQIGGAIVDIAATAADIATGNIDENTTAKEATRNRVREECLNGLAYTLAKNQLTSMTRSTMNWVNTGFDGNPFFVRNMDSFLNSITTEIQRGDINFYKDPNNAANYPYGRDTARSMISQYQAANNFKDSMKQNLTNYLDEGTTIKDYSNDFSKGGWDGWLALTQKPQNNPLGFSMLTSQNLADKSSNAIQNVKDELTQTGFLSQKKCVETSEDAETCTKYEVVTPGSLIKDKVSTYLNSPERQLELADNINESLNALFTSLLSRFENQGLTSLSSSVEEFANIETSGGLGSNSISDVLGGGVDASINSDSLDNTDKNNTNYANFDITKDLGDTYTSAKYMGVWDASTNTPELLPNVGTKNTYYRVTTGGEDPGLLKRNYTWKFGDEAFFDGTNWQKGRPKLIVENKGIIHIQQDYIDAVTPLISLLPTVTKSFGKLDYCIPGPNPSWKNNSQDAKNAFSDLVNNLDYKNFKFEFYKNSSNNNDVMSAYNKNGDNYFHNGSFTKGNFLTPNIVFSGNRNNQTENNIDPSYYNFNYFYDYPQSGDGTDLTSYKNLFNDTVWKDKISPLLNQQINYYDYPGYPYPNGETISKVFDNLKKYLDLNTGSLYVKNYELDIDKIYGSKLDGAMQKEINDDGNNNPNYLEMASTGLNLTKNLVTYANNNEEALTNYNQSLLDAKANVVKLKAIQKRVNEIVKAAQNRRALKMAKENLDAISADCLAEEDINYMSLGNTTTDTTAGNDIIR